MSDASPCLSHGCHACCVGTEMTLTLADVARLESLGQQTFWREGRDGSLHLRNRGGRCVFLREGLCEVYHARPEGCAVYPLILDLEAGRAVRDEFCPHRDEFRLSAVDEETLRSSVEREEREADARRRAR